MAELLPELPGSKKWPRGPAGPEVVGTWVTTGLEEVRRGAVWLARVALPTEACGLITCAELALCDVQDEGVRSHAEVTGALSQERWEGWRKVTTRGPWEQPGALDPSNGALSSVRVGKNSQEPASLGSSPGSAPS